MLQMTHSFLYNQSFSPLDFSNRFYINSMFSHKNIIVSQAYVSFPSAEESLFFPLHTNMSKKKKKKVV